METAFFRMTNNNNRVVNVPGKAMPTLLLALFGKEEVPTNIEDTELFVIPPTDVRRLKTNLLSAALSTNFVIPAEEFDAHLSVVELFDTAFSKGVGIDFGPCADTPF